MSDRHDQMKARVKALYAASGSGDWEAAEAMLTEDFFASEADHHPMAGIYPGKGGLRALFQRVMGEVAVAGLDIHDIAVGDEHAVVLLDLILAGPPEVRVPIAEMMRFRGDQICEIKPYYFDSAPMRRAAGKA